MKIDKIQIVSFDNPYPPNFGGVIDVYYKIKYLHQLNVDIYLHIFTHDRLDITYLQTYCKAIYIYKRNKSYLKFLSISPFRVKSRVSSQIYKNLKQNDAPILFEGLQSTNVLRHHTFKNKIIIRAHNIEHLYYYGLAKSSPNVFKKLLYLIEGYKFLHYEKIVEKADAILALSKKEFDYFNYSYSKDIYYVPVFHGNEIIFSPKGKGNYALYHGDLSTEDNVASVKFLISVFSQLLLPLHIASSCLPKSLEKLIQTYDHIRFKKLGNQQSDLQELIANAQVNILYSKQATGTKLKVFYALYNGRFCIVNNNIVDDEAILSLCEVANSKGEIINKINDVFDQEFKSSLERERILKNYLPLNQAEQLLTILTKISNTQRNGIA